MSNRFNAWWNATSGIDLYAYAATCDSATWPDPVAASCYPSASVDAFIAWACARKGLQAPTSNASGETYPLACIVESNPVLSSQEGQ